MTLQDYFQSLRSHWIVIVVLMVLGAGSAYGYSQFIDPEYRAESQVIVIPTRGENTSELVQGSNYVQSLVQTYTLLVKSPTVLDPVIADLGLDETANRLARRVDVNVPLNTVVIEIGVTDASGESAAETANAIAQELATAVAGVSPVSADGEPAVRVDTISAARTPTVPISPNTRLNVMVGAVAGIALGVVFALLRRLLATRITTARTLSDATEVALLGEIPEASDTHTIARIIRSQPDGRVAEAMRQVAASLKFVDVDKNRRVILVTSCSAQEGKSSVSLGLALTLAEGGRSVLFIEADLRRPSTARYTQLEGSIGLTTVLIGDVELADAVQQWGRPGLDILTAGAQPPNPGQLLSSGGLHRIVDEARDSYDYVIIDTAPVLSVSDALWLSTMADGTLFVVRSNRTKAADLTRALGSLESTRTPVLGIVLNGVRGAAKSPYYTDEPRRGVRPRLAARAPR
ncbi:polysaccharide biosynthesis tyrosine autokinase [Microbacterium galbinum]|uniref:polysaccharide biosynthesis tyrosine autokinase n=1 Tax=Microbacterium galbinum TaxID=2851646 RepID=UPI001FFD3F1F|nr:polysaccharide biosynthesis tyrosine autokinase [Microbacterium galbinum]MCK2029561.1 polysaccharide biosynthesis tyrosine autokinase [Microbacterium galbinum]